MPLVTPSHDWRAASAALRRASSRSASAFMRSAAASRDTEDTRPPAYKGRFSCRPIVVASERSVLGCGRLFTPWLATMSTVGKWPARARSTSRAAISRASCWACTPKLPDSAAATQSAMFSGCGRCRATPSRSPASGSGCLPMTWASVWRATSSWFCAAISCAEARSKRDCASCTSVMVTVPTSKLVLASSSCSAAAVRNCVTASSASCALSTLK